MYLEYEELRRRYNEALEVYNGIVAEKEELFSRTQPKSVRYDRERVAGGTPGNPFEEYVVMMEKRRVNERLAEARSITDDRKRIMEHKEWELRRSQDIADRIYVRRILDRWRIGRICKETHYQEAQVHRYLHEIKENIKKIENDSF